MPANHKELLFYQNLLRTKEVKKKSSGVADPRTLVTLFTSITSGRMTDPLTSGQIEQYLTHFIYRQRVKKLCGDDFEANNCFHLVVNKKAKFEIRKLSSTRLQD
jgi:hypothetical protein